MRLFACTLLSPPRQAAYERAMAALIASAGGVLRPIPGGSAHLTYAFVGAAPPERLGDLAAAMRTVAARHPPIAIRFGAPHVLYGGAEARLICAPVARGGMPLSALAADVVAVLARELSAAAVKGSRSHHVTLARFRNRTRRAEARGVVRALGREVIADDDDEALSRLQLMSSALTPAGPVYMPIVDVPLADALPGPDGG